MKAFRRHFDESELQRIDGLITKFELLASRGLVTRKLDKWAAVVHFRMTQLATAQGFAFSSREVTKIKGAYFHAHGKAEREADKILERQGVSTASPAHEAMGLDERQLAMDLHATMLAIAQKVEDGIVRIFEAQATWRFIAIHVVLNAAIDDEPFREKCLALQSLERELLGVDTDARRTVLLRQLELTEARVDVELQRLLEIHGLEDTVGRIQELLTTSDPESAVYG